MQTTYQIKKETIDRILEIAQRAHAKAVQSPFWAMVKENSEVVEMQRALGALESEVKAQQAPPSNPDWQNP